MIKVTNPTETDNVKPLMLRAYIAKKITALMEEYSVDSLADIGCFVVLIVEEADDEIISYDNETVHFDEEVDV